MAQVLVTESYLDGIADAIRGQNGSNSTYTPAQMAGAVNALYPEPSGTIAITQNGTVDVKSKASANVNVPNTYDASDNGKVVVNQALVSQTQKNINTNGTHDTTANNSVVVDVPNSYAAVDEGKVVSSGALVAQTSQNISENGTYDTTLNNEVVVNVDGGSGGGGQGVIIDPSFQGLAYIYVSRNGETIFGNDTKNQSINIFVVKANHKYVLFVDEIGTRRRCGFFQNITLNDIIYEANNAHQQDIVLHSGGTWLAPFVQNTDDSGDLLYGRIIHTPETNGLIIFGTSNDGTVVPAYCVDITQYA